MRTTIDINDAKLQELRDKARSEGRSFRAVLDEVLALGLAAIDRSETERKSIRLPTHSLGTKPGFQGMSFNQLYDQIEAEEDARFH